MKRLDELRKWDLTPIGAVLAVILLAVVGYAVFIAGGPPSTETLVRRYYASPRGGDVPQEVVRRIQVGGCQAIGRFAGDDPVYQCDVTLGQHGYAGCFALSGHEVTKGSAELGENYGCVRLVWSPRNRKLMLDPQPE